MEYKFTLKKLWKHICTVCEHKKNVARYCFKFGIGWRGIMHDMHKFSWTELYESAKYYTGEGSPIPVAKRENNGVSMAWLHHKNHPLGKHHYEYWQCNFDKGRRSLIMPFVYNLEALCDYLGACKTYGNLTNDMDVYESELKFWKEVGRPNSVAMHEVNKMFIDACLEKLVKDGKLSRKTAEEYYSVCLYTYEYKELKKRIKNMFTLTVVNADKLYFSSDSHFGHFNICKYCHRPFESRSQMDSDLIANWNSVVPEDGVVVHCGDFMLPHKTSDKEYKKIWDKLNFKTLVLCRGNHDRIDCGTYVYDDKTVFVVDIAKIEVEGIDIMACHYPMLAYPADYQVFGHIHTLSDGTCYGIDGDVNARLRKTQYDVGADQNNYTPVSYWQLVDIFRNKAREEK